MTHFAILRSDGLNCKEYDFYNYHNGEVFARLTVYDDYLGSHEDILSGYVKDLSGCLSDIVSKFSYTTKTIPPEYDGKHKHDYEDIRGWKTRVGRENKLKKLGI